MKKTYIFLVVILLIGGAIGFYFLNNKDKSETKYYSYESDGKFVMSSYANKVDDYKKLDNAYFIKENITNVTSKEEIMEVMYSGSVNETYYPYGYYTSSEFKKYFSKEIENGFVCNGETIYYLDEGASYKCVKHESGYKYQKIDSELCITINDKLVCIKSNDWDNYANYKKLFEDAGWVCEYSDYTTGKKSLDKVPTEGTMECSKTKPSVRNVDDNELFCYIGTDGEATCSNNNTGWCSINNDLNTYCFGID